MADSSSPPSEGDSTSLAHQINVAIASSHTKINRLILDRMPRAVPPQTDNPSTYITGLLHIGAVYIAFESLWQNILGIHSDIAPIPYTYPFSGDPSQHDGTPQITERTRHILEKAYWSALLRAARIKADIRSMTGWPDHIIDEQIRSVGTSGRLGKLTLHIRDSVNAKPHLLLAYAYCLYLALLSGGSYIRTELMYLKSEFWQETPTPIMPNMVECKPKSSLKEPKHQSTADYDANSHGLARHDSTIKVPLEFLDFDPPLGENPRQQTKELKAEFKTRFADAEQSLAEPERKDIIKESVAIFHNLEGVVGQLDKLCGTSQGKGHVQRVLHAPNHSPRGASLGFRLRDSIAIAKGRLLRTRRKSSVSSVTATVPTTLTGELTDSHNSAESSKPSSVSETSGEYKDAQLELKQQEQESGLVRDVVVPGEGFRTIHFKDFPRPRRSSPSKCDDEKSSNPHGFDGANFHRASADVEYCPISRVPTMKEAVVQKDSPNYALYAVISNLVMLLGIAIMFAAYLHVRRGEIAGRPVDL